MSVRTLTTRVGGYKFVIETNGSQAIGEFDPENGDGMSLPYELRSCWTNNTGQTMGILAAAIGSYEQMMDRLLNHNTNNCMEDTQGFGCEKETALDNDYARRYMFLRGNQWKFNQQIRRNYALMEKFPNITVAGRNRAPQV